MANLKASMHRFPSFQEALAVAASRGVDLCSADGSSSVEALKRRAMAAIDSANASHGAANEVAGLREAIEALPDRSRLAALPADVRVFIETALSAIGAS